MASIGEAEVDRVATLARLRLDLEARRRMVRELDAILAHLKALDRLDLDGVPPTAQASSPTSNVLRDDTVGPSLPQSEALRAAPDVQAGMFRVPRVVGEP